MDNFANPLAHFYYSTIILLFSLPVMQYHSVFQNTSAIMYYLNRRTFGLNEGGTKVGGAGGDLYPPVPLPPWVKGARRHYTWCRALNQIILTKVKYYN